MSVDIRYKKLVKTHRENAQGYWVSSDCVTGKRTFLTRAAAKAAAKMAAKRGMGNMRPYQCKLCDNSWHIGHPRTYND